MKFGYILENFGEHLQPGMLLETSKLAEQLHFHSIWTTDHIMQPFENRIPLYNKITEAIVTLAYIAGQTEKIKLGISTIVLPIRETILVAKQLASLDYLTGGRLIASFGTGWNEEEFQFLNSNFKNRGKRMNEQLEVIKTLWEGKTNFKGKNHQFENASFEPRAKNLTNVPFLIAGNSIHALKRAIKYGSGWHPAGGITPTEIRERIKELGKEKIPENFEIWVRKKFDQEEDFSEMVNNYKEVNVTGIVLDASRTENKTPKDKLLEMGKRIK